MVQNNRFTANIIVGILAVIYKAFKTGLLEIHVQNGIIHLKSNHKIFRFDSSISLLELENHIAQYLAATDTAPPIKKKRSPK